MTQLEARAEAVRPVRRRRRTSARRLLVIAGVTLAAGYLAMCIGVCHFQERLIYFPEARYMLTPAAVRLDYEEVRLTAADGVELAAWFIPHADPRGTVLVCGGNGGNMTDVVQAAKSLHRLGYQVMLFDYRGYGASGGRPSENGVYQDAEAAWNHVVNERGVPPERMILFGRSLGGAVAIELASRHAPAALIVECTFTSLVEIGRREYPFLPVALLSRNHFESIRKVPALHCPKLFLHGCDDEVIPLSVGRALFEAAAEPKEFLETPGKHNNSGFEYNEEFVRRLGEWLAAHGPRG